MVRATLAKLRSLSRAGARPERVSILLPFLIISIGLGVLAWRSYNLSMRMERGAGTLAVQYAGYAAEITARRVDAAVRAELARAPEEWQALERRTGEPTYAALSEWLADYNWIVNAIYIPDYDPASSIFVRDPGHPSNAATQTREFFTSSGMVRYGYDPQRLLEAVHGAVRQQPLVKTNNTGTILQHRADVTVVKDARSPGLQRDDRSVSFISPLSPPLETHGIRAVVFMSYVGSGWENQRLISAILSLVALCLTTLGALLALRGLKKESETMKLRGALIANVSHELRTPLSMIRLAAETLKRGKLRDHERQAMEDQILREALLLSHLVENVLDVARMQNQSTKALAFTPVQPRDLVKNLLTTYESWISSKGFEVALQIDESINAQMWDRDAVSRALLNLIDNAIKYSAEEKRIGVTLRQTDEHVILEVSDHGIGISTTDAAKIFEPYFRAQFSDTITRRGAGLGLTLVQQIVESHGGRVECESESGRGSTFRLLFPRHLGQGEEMTALARPREAF